MLLIYDQVAYNLLENYTEKIVSNIVEKISTLRPNIQKKGKSLLMKIIEVNEPKIVMEVLYNNLKNKKPKAAIFCFEVLLEIINNFGLQELNFKELISKITEHFNNTNNVIRDLCMEILTSLYKLIGNAPLGSLLESLRPAQKTEFERLCQEINEKGEGISMNNPPAPIIILRKNVSSISSSNTSGSSSGGTANLKDFIEEVDLIKKLKGTDYLTLLNSHKWSEQVKGLDLIINSIGPIPKIKYNTIISELLVILNNLLKNNNTHIQVQIKCIKVVDLFFEGISNKTFNSAIKNNMIMSNILSKTKEKKISHYVVNNLILGFRFCLNYEYYLNDLIELINNKKSPAHCKIYLLQLFSYILLHNNANVNGVSINSNISTELTNTQVVVNYSDYYINNNNNLLHSLTNESIKAIFNCCVINSDESDPKVREESYRNLYIIFINSRNFPKYFSDFNECMANVQSNNNKLFKKLCDGVLPSESNNPASAPLSGTVSLTNSINGPITSVPVISTNMSSTLPPQPLQSSSSNFPSQPNTLNKTMSGPPTTNSKNTMKKTGSTTSVTATTSSSSVPSTASKLNLKYEEFTDKVEIPISIEDSVDLIIEYGIKDFDSVPDLLYSNNWNEKVQGINLFMESINENINNGKDLTLNLAYSIYLYLEFQTEEFKINNVNILKKLIELFSYILSCVSEKNAIILSNNFINLFYSKISNKKLTSSIEELFDKAIENIGLFNLLKKLISLMDKKNTVESSADSESGKDSSESNLTINSYIIAYIKKTLINNEFNSNSFPLLNLIQVLVKELNNKLLVIRNAALDLLGFLYTKFGQPIIPYVLTKDLSYSVKTLIENEFSKISPTQSTGSLPQVPPPKSTSSSSLVPPPVQHSSSSTQPINQSNIQPSNQFNPFNTSSTQNLNLNNGQRKDIYDIIDKITLQDLNNTEAKDNWLLRKNSMEKIIKIIHSIHYNLEYNKNLMEFLKIVKLRINDTQSNLRPIAVQLLGLIFYSLEHDKVIKILKNYVKIILLSLCDNKKTTREATIECLNLIIRKLTGNQSENVSEVSSENGETEQNETSIKNEQIIFMIIFNNSHEIFQHVIGRHEFLIWLTDNLIYFHGDCNDLTESLLLTLQDKVTAVRNLGEKLLIHLLKKKHISKTNFEKHIRDLTVAVQRSIQNILDRINSAVKLYEQSKPQTLSNPNLHNINTNAMTASLITPLANPLSNPLVNSLNLSAPHRYQDHMDIDDNYEPNPEPILNEYQKPLNIVKPQEKVIYGGKKFNNTDEDQYSMESGVISQSVSNSNIHPVTNVINDIPAISYSNSNLLLYPYPNRNRRIISYLSNPNTYMPLLNENDNLKKEWLNYLNHRIFSFFYLENNFYTLNLPIFDEILNEKYFFFHLPNIFLFLRIQFYKKVPLNNQTNCLTYLEKILKKIYFLNNSVLNDGNAQNMIYMLNPENRYDYSNLQNSLNNSDLDSKEIGPNDFKLNPLEIEIFFPHLLYKINTMKEINIKQVEKIIEILKEILPIHYLINLLVNCIEFNEISCFLCLKAIGNIINSIGLGLINEDDLYKLLITLNNFNSKNIFMYGKIILKLILINCNYDIKKLKSYLGSTDSSNIDSSCSDSQWTIKELNLLELFTKFGLVTENNPYIETFTQQNSPSSSMINNSCYLIDLLQNSNEINVVTSFEKNQYIILNNISFLNNNKSLTPLKSKKILQLKKLKATFFNDLNNVSDDSSIMLTKFEFLDSVKTFLAHPIDNYIKNITDNFLVKFMSYIINVSNLIFYQYFFLSLNFDPNDPNNNIDVEKYSNINLNFSLFSHIIIYLNEIFLNNNVKKYFLVNYKENILFDFYNSLINLLNKFYIIKGFNGNTSFNLKILDEIIHSINLLILKSSLSFNFYDLIISLLKLNEFFNNDTQLLQGSSTDLEDDDESTKYKNEEQILTRIILFVLNNEIKVIDNFTSNIITENPLEINSNYHYYLLNKNDINNLFYSMYHLLFPILPSINTNDYLNKNAKKSVVPMLLRIIKTILNTFIIKFNEEIILNILIDLNISFNSFFSNLIFHLFPSSINFDQNFDSSNKGNLNLNDPVIEIINEITTTSNNNKEVIIAKLYRLKKENPQINITEYLEKLSKTFRDFVLKVINKFEEQDRLYEEHLYQVQMQEQTQKGHQYNNQQFQHNSTSNDSYLQYHSTNNSIVQNHENLNNNTFAQNASNIESSPDFDRVNFDISFKSINESIAAYQRDQNNNMDDNFNDEYNNNYVQNNIYPNKKFNNFSSKNNSYGTNNNFNNKNDLHNPDEAHRLIESLKTKPPPIFTNSTTSNNNLLSTPKNNMNFNVESSPYYDHSNRLVSSNSVNSPRINASPFSMRNDKIRDSLSTLTKSLELPNYNDLGRFGPNEALEDRLMRLKGMK